MKLNIQLFAISKSTSFSESNLNVTNNTSSLTISIYFSANNSTTWFSSETLYCTCNGVTQSKNVKHPKGGSCSASFTFNNIKHNADGTKTVSWSWNCNTGTAVLDNVSASGTKKLSNLHKPPQINSYTITETNQDLINVGVANDLFVANLSKKSVNINYTLYDNSTLTKATVVNGSNVVEGNLPLLLDYTQKNLSIVNVSNQYKVPIVVKVKDSLNGEGSSNTNYYDYIPYIPVSFTTTTKAKRVGQLSGQVALDIEGVYYNNSIGNVSQGNTYNETQDTEFLDDKNYYILDNTYTLLEKSVDYQVGDDIETYFTTVYDESGTYKPTILYKYWKYGEDEPATYENTILDENITVSNGVFSVSSLNIGSTDETDDNYFNPEFAYRIKIYVEDYFTNVESNELSITIGEAVWTEYKDRVDFKQLTKDGKKVLVPYELFYDANGSNDSITLSDSSSNYEYLEIFYFYNSNHSYLSTKIYNPDGKKIQLNGNYDNSQRYYMITSIYSISGLTITKNEVIRWRIGTGGENNTRTDITSSGSNIYIEKIIGYK